MKTKKRYEQDFLENIAPATRQMSPYMVEGGQEAEVKLNQNENPYDLPDALKRDILEEFRKECWNRYPDVFPNQAIERYARFLGVPKECVIMGNGSNELIYAIGLATLRRNASMLIPSPSFSLYEKVATLLEADVIKVAMTDALEFQVDEILEEAERSRPNLIALCAPNNPTSKSLALEDIEDIVAHSRAIVLVDEAYIEFSKRRSALELLDRYSNLVVLRTFSKAFGLAGLRIGFAIANPALAAELLKPKIPFASNRLAEIALIKLLDNYHVVQNAVASILRERERLYDELRKIDAIKTHESDANFLIIELENPTRVFKALKARGVLVRNVSSYPLMEKCLRVNVGTREENDRFLAALKETLAG
ncbi:MAG: histidinol-phosphate transaminase [Chloroherpetonaceae bacterium]|nr:histidinol-phosphate transaminase [Chloroherpetonaceae bacterium]MDW8437746.1 histidinol-phosphate transaminase [Chloroherpetonaceae bacterium]